MILFLSDLHLGRGGRAADRQVEQDVIDCLDHHRREVRHVFLLGDVFDEYIEYRHLVPKGYVRLLGLLARWTDSGVPVTYLVGNHDPWHRDYFQQELGIRIVRDHLETCLDHRRLFLAHGDRLQKPATFGERFKEFMRHPVPVWAYRTLLPGDFGFGLARFVNRRFGNTDLDPDLVESLRAGARRILRERPAHVVVFGHSHFPELLSWPEGRYLNTGYWHESRTFGRLTGDVLQLVRWNGREGEIVQEQMLDS